jgi:hypothetical protein
MALSFKEEPPENAISPVPYRVAANTAVVAKTPNGLHWQGVNR